jgi:RNA polymerase sigma-70 factor (ECF subfamily)
MREAQPDFTLLMQRLNSGDQSAAQELFERYGPHIHRVVRRKLNHKLRSKFDSLDFVQDVWTSFFTDRERPCEFTRPEALVAFLANMAYHKVVDAFRQRVQTRKYDLNREHSLDSSTVSPEGALVARQPTPSQVAVAKERWDLLLEGQPSRYREILERLREGNTHEEVARELGLNEKTVRRVIKRVCPDSTA